MEFLDTSCPHCTQSTPPSCQHPSPMVHSWQSMEPILTCHNHPKSTVCMKFCSGCYWYSMGLNEHIMTCIHHHCFIQNAFTALKILCFHLLIHLSPVTLALQKTKKTKKLSTAFYFAITRFSERLRKYYRVPVNPSAIFSHCEHATFSGWICPNQETDICTLLWTELQTLIWFHHFFH